MNSAVILKALIVVTSHAELGDTGKATGWYLPEVTHAYYPLKAAGYQIDFASPKGGSAPMDEGSYDMDDELNRRFVQEGILNRLKTTLPIKNVKAKDYGLIFFAGGHGTMWDFANSPDLNRVTAEIYENGGIVAAVCHGPAALTNVKLSNGKYLVDGKKVAAFSNDEEEAAGLTKVMPFLLESKLKDRGAKYSKAPLWQKHVVTDGRLVTGQNPASANETALQAIQSRR